MVQVGVPSGISGIRRCPGTSRGRRPKLTPAREALLVDLHRSGQKNPSQLAELFGVGRSTVYRALQRAGEVPNDQQTTHGTS